MNLTNLRFQKFFFLLITISIAYYYLFIIKLPDSRYNDFLPQSIKMFIYYSDFKYVLEFLFFAIPLSVVVSLQAIFFIRARFIGFSRIICTIIFLIYNFILLGCVGISLTVLYGFFTLIIPPILGLLLYVGLSSMRSKEEKANKIITTPPTNYPQRQ
ncbi:MAG: hypothetical protein QG568_765 [Patescibacteria group bacterium]|nr:hypothetical protein [Patescibacteria group bacterium]